MLNARPRQRGLSMVELMVALTILGFAMAAGMPPGLAALVLQAQVVFTVVIAAGVLREAPTRPQAVGVVIGPGPPSGVR